MFNTDDDQDREQQDRDALLGQMQDKPAGNAPVSKPPNEETAAKNAANPYYFDMATDEGRAKVQGQNLDGTAITKPAAANTGGQYNIPVGSSPGNAAKYLLSQGMKGKDVTDYLRGQGYSDNGLYYPDSGAFGFAHEVVGADGNVMQRGPDGGSGGGTPQTGGEGDPGASPWTNSVAMPTSSDFFTKLMDQLKAASGGQGLDAQALLTMLGNR